MIDKHSQCQIHDGLHRQTLTVHRTEKRRRPTTRTTRFSRYSSLMMVASLLLLLVLVPTTSQAAEDPQVLEHPYLDESSVVLVTGAAGFLGSELALALYRTYQPKQIICVDRMTHSDTSSTTTTSSSSQEALALFEFQRQRVFTVLQTLGPVGRFYRVDLRPMIPEYYDVGSVSSLDHIWRAHPDITHIVHLADPFPHHVPAPQAVPREVDVPKAGMMEALLEQLLKVQRESKGTALPQFVYASSSEVYRSTTNQTLLLEESQPISTPSSMRGVSKLMDEMLAKLYYDNHGLYSIGMRFFSVYGPWSTPGSPIFDLAERAVTGEVLFPATPPTNTADKTKNTHRDVQDWVYIDDAVDAIMAAMQFRPKIDKPHPVIFNAATGQGTSLEEVGEIMTEYFPSGKASEYMQKQEDAGSPYVSVGSVERSRKYLGYQPQVTLRDGILQTLAWHFDRAYPYGGRQNNNNDDVASSRVSDLGIVSCLPRDKECLRAAPVFPCASECSHEQQCTHTYYDEVIGKTQALTSQCDAVLYTVDLNPTLQMIPSAHTEVQIHSKSFLEGTCNLAFVAASSPLAQSLHTSSFSFFSNASTKLMKHGKWILIPVQVPTVQYEEDELLKFLPKVSPSFFFAPSVKRAIYCDPDILLDSIPNLLREAAMQPYSEEMDGATALLIGKGRVENDFFGQEDDTEDDEQPPQAPQKLQSIKSTIQNAAYRMVHIAVSDKLFGDGFMELLDSRWMVHTLQSDDSRLFRCDVLGEIVQWEVDEDRSALEFVLSLHDLWSRVIVSQQSNGGAWWIGESVKTVPEDDSSYSAGTKTKRRLQEDVDDEAGDASEEKVVISVENFEKMPGEEDSNVDPPDAPEEDENDEDGEGSGNEEKEVDGAAPEQSEEADDTPKEKAAGNAGERSNKEDDDNAGDAPEEEIEQTAEDTGREKPEDREQDGTEEENLAEEVSGDKNEAEGNVVDGEENVELVKVESSGFGEAASDDEKEEEAAVADQDNAQDDDDETPVKDTGADTEIVGESRGFAGEDNAVENEVHVAGDNNRGGSSADQGDDENTPEHEEELVAQDSQEDQLGERDFSEYDTWMGILSASSTKYFVRIVPSSEVGVVSLADYDKSTS